MIIHTCTKNHKNLKKQCCSQFKIQNILCDKTKLWQDYFFQSTTNIQMAFILFLYNSFAIHVNMYIKIVYILTWVYMRLGQNKNMCVFQVSALKKLGMVGWDNIL